MSTPETPPHAIHEEREINLAPNIYSAVQHLCVKAAPTLSEKEREWLARCGDSAELALQNMSDAVEFLGCRMALSAASSEDDLGMSGIPSLLLVLAECTRAINAQVFLRGFANNPMRFREAA